MLEQQLSAPVPAGHVVIPGPPVAQLAPVVVEPAHAPPLHAPVAHGQALPHWPLEPHVCTAVVPEHCCEPGAHTAASPPLLPDPELLPLLEPELFPPLDPELLPLLLPEPLLDPELLPPDEDEAVLSTAPASATVLSVTPPQLAATMTARAGAPSARYLRRIVRES